MKNTNTYAIVFLKAHSQNLPQMNKDVKEICQDYGQSTSEPKVELALACGGYFDCVLLVNSHSIEQIGNFVMKGLREKYAGVIADTQTFICWKIS
ncbi:MAG: hypothetical protein AB1393_10815 [Candidatus Edwardsbacteria bacterium]